MSKVTVEGQTRHSLTRVAYRFVTGLPLDGVRRTDAGPFTYGTKVLTKTGRASRWSRLPHAKRAGYRLGSLTAAVGGSIGYMTHPLITEVSAASVSAAGMTVGTYKARRTLKTAKRMRTVIRPLAASLVPIVEMPEREILARLEVPDNPEKPDAFVSVPIPDHYAARSSQMADITRLVSQRVGGEWDTAWQLKRSPFYAHFTPKPAPPSFVSFAQVRDAILSGDIDHPVLGLGSRGEVITLDFAGEIAHLAGSIATGGGKSSFLRGQVAQFSYHGCDEFHVMDTKWVSLQGMEVIPGMHIYNRVTDIFDGIAYVRAEMDRRYDVLSSDPAATFPTMVLILEEQNAFGLEASVWWRENKPKGERRNRPPVWTDIALILLKARQVNIRVMGMYQYLNADACGGIPEIRGQYGQRLIGRFDPQMWDLLVGTKPRPSSSAIQGRVISVLGGIHQSVQLPYISVKEAVELALSRPGGFPGVSRHGARGTDPLVTDPTGRDVTGSEPVTEPAETRYTLPEACRVGILPMTPDNARQARSRDRRKPVAERVFPVGVKNGSGQETYTAGELRYWLETNKQAA